MKKTTLLAALLLCGALSSQAQVTTKPVGFSSVGAATGGTTLVVPTLCNATVFTGEAAISANGLNITPTLAPAWTLGAYAPTAFVDGTPNYPRFYVEIITGSFEGLGFDVISNSATALTVGAGEVPAALLGQTVQVSIRPHLTLDNIVSAATGLTAYADSVSIFNSNGTQSTRYFDGTTWIAEDFATPAGHTVIYPGTGFAFSSSGSVTWTFVGDVKPTKTMINLYAGATNIVGPLSPAAASPLFGNSIAAALAPYADGFNVFSTNGQMTIVGTYYSDGASVLDASFTPLASNASDTFGLNRGAVVSVTTDTVWTVPSPLAP